jgi:UDP-N-acetylmuramoylalanine--D-glutamate ligase
MSGQPIVWVGGNIGNPLIADVTHMAPQDLAVMELSSFQLEIMTRSPQVAVVLNLTPNHLDRHQTMDAYGSAKRNLLRYQNAADLAVIRRDDPGSWSMRDEVRGRLAIFGLDAPKEDFPAAYVRGGEIHVRDEGEERSIMPISGIPLGGVHNLLNVLAAVATARVLKFKSTSIRSGVEGFAGLPHRLERVRVWNGAVWVNDSIATAPERTIAALRAVDPPIILLAGGRDKNLPWAELADEIHQRVDHLIAFGEAASIVIRAVGEPVHGGKLQTVSRCEGLHAAVLEAARLVEPGDTVLLAPGGTSFDEFRDFEERGDHFKTWVNQLL